MNRASWLKRAAAAIAANSAVTRLPRTIARSAIAIAQTTQRAIASSGKTVARFYPIRAQQIQQINDIKGELWHMTTEFRNR